MTKKIQPPKYRVHTVYGVLTGCFCPWTAADTQEVAAVTHSSNDFVGTIIHCVADCRRDAALRRETLCAVAAARFLL